MAVISSGRVVGQFAVGIADDIDVDYEPDIVPASGTIIFKGEVPYIPVVGAVPNPITVMTTTIIGVLDSQGYLCTPNPTTPTLAGERGLRLFASDAVESSVKGWTWKVTYKFDPVNNSTPSIPSHSIALLADQELDLTEFVQVPSSPGVGVVQALAMVSRAEDAALESADNAATAQAAVQQVASVITSTDEAMATIAADPASAFRGEQNAAYAPVGGWISEWVKDAFARPNIGDTPTIAWATTNTTALASPAIFKPAILGIGHQTLNWDGTSDTVFRYFSGLFNSGNGGNADLALYGATKPGGVAQAATWPIVISFVTDATNTIVEIPFYNSAAGALLIEVNGRLLSDASIVYIPSPARQLTLTFPTPASRTIRIWGANGIEAVRVPTGGTLTKPAASPLRIAIIGDSWVNGQGASWGTPPFGATNIESFAPRLLRMMGAGDMILAGIGGTGWVAGTDTGGGSNAYNTRLAAVLAMNPDVLIFYGSQNDGATDPSGTLQAAVASTLASASTVPKVYVISTMLNGYSAANAAVKAATIAAGRRFIDMTNFIYGTGSSVAPAQDGNRDVYLMGVANLHMTFQGHKAAAAAVYAKIMTPGA